MFHYLFDLCAQCKEEMEAELQIEDVDPTQSRMSKKVDPKQNKSEELEAQFNQRYNHVGTKRGELWVMLLKTTILTILIR